MLTILLSQVVPMIMMSLFSLEYTHHNLMNAPFVSGNNFKLDIYFWSRGIENGESPFVL